MNLHVPFDNSYGRLPDRFFTRIAPTPVTDPSLIALNDPLARDLGLDPKALRAPDGVAALAGNAVPEGADPLAQAYAGHQFGGFSPQLGDGRAILLGEVLDSNGIRRDIQLKGSGPTPYSRMGDGRAWVGPVLREYIVSEAMHALGIPTTRALAAVATGEPVVRERPFPGAVLTRVASSHIRVGTFQFFAVREDAEAIEKLTQYVIERHYPDATDALDLLNRVIARQARLVAQWMGVGFIHGVMNTDNTHVAGETIDYGPCAFMDAYHPGKVFSSIDQFGRYAYGKQPEIAVWNLAQFATAILPLIDADRDTAIEKATEAVHRFPDLYADAWAEIFRAKIGLATAEPEDIKLIERLLTSMATLGADFTNTFRALSGDDPAAAFAEREAFDAWAPDWHARLERDGQGWPAQKALMERTNPAVTPRNHRIEQAISAAVKGDYSPFFKLNEVLATPFALSEPAYADPPKADEEVRRTFCGT
ncbi:YdiU family protein [Psychromarinibacter sp. C21-152]|uniref:Protein nucleotidyltransferase YdiU n=1 Tax=Psychromarinibacter sediminicola TaxID=3033385 RepID=A0AAE3NRX5_9RHOB|nr:YdiU family protein [Psychromarinibacter sediminicola]MDF0600901.1 YdiU family protein [Psychromarinibacter sediminicola]